MQVRVYHTLNTGWWCGPLGAWRVGDVIDVPARPPRYGMERPAGKGIVVRVDPRDGMAFAERHEEVPYA